MAQDHVRVPTAPGLRGFAPEPPAVSQPEGLVPSRVEDYLAKARVWTGDRDLLERMCKARPYVRSGRFAARLEDVGDIRYAPRLARKNVILGSHHSYATRAEAMAAAKRYRDQCRTFLSAIILAEEIDAQAGTRPQGQDGEAGLGRSPSDAVGNADAPEPSRHTSKGI